MCDNCRYVDMCKNLPENLSTTGLYRIISVFYYTLQNCFCISRQEITEIILSI
jgi:hypothetical protein